MMIRFHSFLALSLFLSPLGSLALTSKGTVQSRSIFSSPKLPGTFATTTTFAKSKSSNDDTLDFVNYFCHGTNEFWKNLVIQPVKDYVEIQQADTISSNPFSKLIAPPQIPGIPRPVWLTILGSVPTGLGWYGYYKFSVEEELFQFELQEEGRVTGCGGYGTLLPFVFGVIIGFPLKLLGVPLGDLIVQAAAVWILLGQVNLYRRVNELTSEGEDGAEQLHTWWALLPPPLDVVVGLRQVHFLSEYWRVLRDEPYDKDIIAEELFPFISVTPRFTLKEFFRTPSIWFWFTKDWEDFEYDFFERLIYSKDVSGVMTDYASWSEIMHAAAIGIP